jgi:hypothetical protein
MFDLKKFFLRGTTSRESDPDSEYHPSDRSTAGLQVEYQTMIANQFRRWGISASCTTIEVRKLGQAPDGYDVFVGLVRLTRWERESALRVLLGLPLLEAKVRKTLRATWLADFSHFAGLWLHSSEQVHQSPELHALLGKLAPLTPSSHGSGPQDSRNYGSSSLPPSSQGRSEPDEESVGS